MLDTPGSERTASSEADADEEATAKAGDGKPAPGSKSAAKGKTAPMPKPAAIGEKASEAKPAGKAKSAGRAKPHPAPASGDQQMAGVDYPVVGVGASAGGLEAMKTLLAHLAKQPDLTIIYVQHLDPSYESAVPAIFRTITHLPVIRAAEGLVLGKGNVYVAPPHQDIRIEGGIIHVVSAPAREARPRPIDRFLTFLADEFGSGAIGVVLSGTMTDGTQGIQAIKRAGGYTFAQDEATAKFDSMPKSAAASGAVDFVLPPELIAKELCRIARRFKKNGVPRAAERPGQNAALPARRAPEPTSDPLQRILNLVWSVTGTDFQGYKRAMIRRRVLRRMLLAKMANLGDFAEFLRDHPAAVQELFQDLLITVTSFFRDPELYKFLSGRIFPEMVKDRPSGTPIRIWIPACSTGEEVFSFAITFFEFLGSNVDRYPLQVFATDLSEEAIERARRGAYVERQLEGVSAERRRRYFRKSGDQYLISKRVRDSCIFAVQNLVKDPPFSRMDLISCQNLLIYFDPELQRRALEIFHYALQDRGFLVLGPSESASAVPELFSPLSKSHKVFQKRAVSRPIHLGFAARPAGLGDRRSPMGIPSPGGRIEPDILQEVDRAVLARHAPPGVLVNEKMEIVQFRGACSPFIEPMPGVASFNLFKMIKEDLAIQIRPLIASAGRTPGALARQRLVASADGHNQEVEVEVQPIVAGGDDHKYFLISFLSLERGPEPGVGPGAPASGGAKGEADRSLATSLHRELIAAKEQLRSVVSDSEAKTEELNSALEEVTSTNEELQSINEELETAKEELQSTNEELSTVNEELQSRNVELSLLYADMNNFIASVDIPIVMLGVDNCIRRYTPTAAPLLNLRPADVGRPLTELRPLVDVPDLEESLAKVVNSGKSVDLEATDSKGRDYAVWMRPYLTSESKVEGAVVVFLDITSRKRGELAARESADNFRTVLDHMPVMLVAYNEGGDILAWNAECERVTGYSAQDVMHSPEMSFKLFPDFTSGKRDLLERHFGGDYRGWERRIRCKDGTERDITWFNVSRFYKVPGWATWEVGIDAKVVESASPSM